MWKFWLVGGVAAVMVLVAFPVLQFLAIGVLATFFVMALYIALTGLSREGVQRAQEQEQARKAAARRWARLQIRREARHLAAVEAEKENIIRAGR